MIARTFLKQDPFVVWGDGTKVRNWIYALDIDDGMILEVEKIDHAFSINLGTEECFRDIDAVYEFLFYSGYDAEIKFTLDKPPGPLKPAASNSLA